MRRGPALVVAATALALLPAACGAEEAAGDGLLAVATTSILGDVLAEIVGDAGRVEVLIPRGADPHEFQASSRQLALLLEADLVVVNGLGLEEGLLDVIEAARRDGANVLEIGALLDPIPLGEGAGPDPHVWMDPIRMIDAAALIAAELAGVSNDADWGAAAEAYSAELRAAHEEILAILAVVAPQDRKLVTSHHSMGYFAARYGFEIVGVVLPGGSTLANPSSAQLAALVAVVRDAAVPAMFAETTEPDALARAVAAELGGEVAVVELYTGSLGEPGSEAVTLVELLVTDASRIAAALGPRP